MHREATSSMQNLGRSMHSTKLCIQIKRDIAEKIVKTELSYYVHTHHAERNMEPTLFKIMIPHDECLENLLLLLGDNNCLAI